MRAIPHLLLSSVILFSCIRDSLSYDQPMRTPQETRKLEDKKGKNKEFKSPKKGKKETKSPKKGKKETKSPKEGKKETKSPKKEKQGGNERVRMTGDEDAQFIEVDKYAIRRAKVFLAVDADGDEQVALEEIMTHFDENECDFPITYEEADGTFNTDDTCTPKSLTYQWCSNEAESNGVPDKSYWWCSMQTKVIGEWKYTDESGVISAWEDAYSRLDTNEDGKLSKEEIIAGPIFVDNRIHNDVFAFESVCNNPLLGSVVSECEIIDNIISIFENSEVFYMKDGTCTLFYSNPLEIDENRRRDTWVRQVRPCGYYKEIYSDMACTIPKDFVTIDANTDYPGAGALGDIVLDDLYLVKFDVGRHPEQPASSDNNLDFSAINFNESEGVGDPSDIMKPNVEGETCLETFIFGGDSFGELHGNNGNCMGYCGPGCYAFGSAYDCMKHDTCSYYKTIVQGSGAEGFYLDVDCGDEAAQATINCWDENGWFFDIPAICEFDNEDIYAEINPFNMISPGGRQGCLDRTGRDRGQGMPRPWNYPDGRRKLSDATPK